MHYMLNKISKRIILLTIIAMVIENKPTRKNNRETTSLKDNAENNNPPEEKNNGNQISIAAWNIKCNNRELPELEKEAIKKRWNIVFISETGLILSKIGPPTTENQILLRDYITVWSSPTKSRLIRRWKGKKIEKINNKYRKQREEERKRS